MAAPLIAAQAVSSMDNKKLLIIGGTVIGVGLLGYFLVARPILQTFGIVDTKEDKKANKEIVLIKDYKGFDPQYARLSKVTLSDSRAKILADKVYDAGGVFNDDEDTFYAVLTEAGTPDNLSMVSHYFQIRHGKSMADWYTYYMSDNDEVFRIKQILTSYPN